MERSANRKLAILIMAAGRSSRFGSCKLLSEIEGKTLLQHSIECVESSKLGDVYVVTGHWHTQINEWAAQQTVGVPNLLYSPNWSDGLGNSIAFGVSQLADDYDGILIMLADQIGLTHEDLCTLDELHSGEGITCCIYNERRGVPALFGRDCFGLLKQLNGDQGAKKLLYDPAINVNEYPCPNASIDIDTPEERQRWLEQLKNNVGQETG